MLLNALKYTTLLLFNHYQASKMESVSKIIILHGMSIPHYSNYDFFPLGKQSLPVNKTPLQNRNWVITDPINKMGVAHTMGPFLSARQQSLVFYLPDFFSMNVVFSIYNFASHILATKSFHQAFTSNSHERWWELSFWVLPES
jgi:hypothetical protein